MINRHQKQQPDCRTASFGAEVYLLTFIPTLSNLSSNLSKLEAQLASITAMEISNMIGGRVKLQKSSREPGPAGAMISGSSVNFACLVCSIERLNGDQTEAVVRHCSA